MRKILMSTICIVAMLLASIPAFSQGIPKDHAQFQKSIACVPVGFSQFNGTVVTLGSVNDPTPLATQGFKDVAKGDAILVRNNDGKWIVTLRKTGQAKAVPFKRDAFEAFIDKMQK